MERTISVWSDRNIGDQLWPVGPVEPKFPFPFDKFVVPSTALLYPAFKDKMAKCSDSMYEGVVTCFYPPNWLSVALTRHFTFLTWNFSVSSLKFLIKKKKIQDGTSRSRSRNIGSAVHHFNPYTTEHLLTMNGLIRIYIYSNNPNPNPNPNPYFVYELLICQCQFGGWK